MKNDFQNLLQLLRVPDNAVYLTNAIAMFQSYINKILVEKLDIFVIVYLDNIFIYTEKEEKKYMGAVSR